MRSRIAAVVLVLVAVLQVGMLAKRTATQPKPVPSPVFLAVGETVPPLHGRFEDGTRGTYRPPNSEGRWTAVLAFRSNCPQMHTAASAWRRWLATAKPLNVLAITRDSLPAAVAYRDGQHWRVPLLSLERPRRGTPEHSLITRTPWVFLLDPSGVVQYQGHGANLAVLDSVIARSVASPVRRVASD